MSDKDMDQFLKDSFSHLQDEEPVVEVEVPKSDFEFTKQDGSSPLRGGRSSLTDTHGRHVDTSSNVSRVKGGIPLVPKYTVIKTDMSPVEEEAVYYVLRLDNSADDRDALRYYATRVRDYNPKLADDIKKLCEGFE